jgi:sigma-54 dependent transcriptional regulator, acetoin dehydrogenase operon transcriptional activator AcoR
VSALGRRGAERAAPVFVFQSPKTSSLLSSQPAGDAHRPRLRWLSRGDECGATELSIFALVEAEELAVTPEQAERTKQAWRRYVATGRISQELLSVHTYDAWLRCKTYGTNPQVMKIRRLPDADTAALLESEAPLISASQPYLRALSLSAGTERHFAAIADGHGILLDVVGHEAALRQTTVFPGPMGPGVCLSEPVVGTGAFGTALAESRYVEIVGPEHFVCDLQMYACQGAPVRGPDGSVVGVIGIVVQRSEAADRVREILFCAAHGIEVELARRHVENDVAHVLADCGATASVDRLWQDLTQLPCATRLTVERAAHVAGKDRPRDAFRLISSADALVSRFARQAHLWREMAYDDHGSAQPIDLNRRIAEIADLLETEAAVRGVLIDVQPAQDFRVTMDVRALSRTVLRALLRALDSVPSDSTLTIRTDRSGDGAYVVFSTGETLALQNETGSEPPA